MALPPAMQAYLDRMRKQGNNVDETAFDEPGTEYDPATGLPYGVDPAAGDDSGMPTGGTTKPSGAHPKHSAPGTENNWENPYKIPSGTAADPGWWKAKIGELSSKSTYVDPDEMFGAAGLPDDYWQQLYHAGDVVNTKQGGNEHFGQQWDPNANGGEGGFVDIDPEDASVAAMFAESKSWKTEEQEGLKNAWINNDEAEFQRWRNIARARQAQEWKHANEAAAPKPTAAPSSGGGGGGGGTPKPATPPSSPYKVPDPYPIRQSPVY